MGNFRAFLLILTANSAQTAGRNLATNDVNKYQLICRLQTSTLPELLAKMYGSKRFCEKLQSIQENAT